MPAYPIGAASSSNPPPNGILAAAGVAGALGLVWTGAWSSSYAYLTGQAVTSSGSSYVAIAPNVNTPPASSPQFWVLIAAAGVGTVPSDLSTYTVTSPSSTTPLPLAQWMSVTFNVAAYGASPAATAAVNTAAIQAAINAAQTAGGGTVLIPAGTYNTNGTLNVTAPVVIRGVGRTASIIKAAIGYAAFTINNSSGSVSSVQIADLGISIPNGNSSSQGIVAGDGTHFATQLTFENLNITGPSNGNGNGIQFNFGLIGRVDDCSITGWNNGILYTQVAGGASNAIHVVSSNIQSNVTGLNGVANDLWVTGSVIEGNTSYGIYSTGGSWNIVSTHFEQYGNTTPDVYIAGGTQISTNGCFFATGTGQGTNFVIAAGAGTNYSTITSLCDNLQSGITSNNVTCTSTVINNKNPASPVFTGAVAVITPNSITGPSSQSYNFNAGSGFSLVSAGAIALGSSSTASLTLGHTSGTPVGLGRGTVSTAPSTLETTAAQYHQATAGQTLTNNANTIINFPQADVDTDSAVTTGSNWRFTVPVNKGGLYWIYSSAGVTGAGNGQVSLLLLHNGANTAQGFANGVSTSVFGTDCGALMNLAAGDTVQVAMYSTTGNGSTLYAGAVSILRIAGS